jgi:putative oligomerization/nucleic acid binding protein
MTSDALVELASIDRTVAFYDDRLEYRSRIGSKHGVIPYRRVNAVDLVEGFALPTIETTNDTIAVIAASSKKMIFALKSRRRPLVFDFRSETSDTVNAAVTIVRRRLARTTRDTEERDIDDAERERRRRADELLAMAERHRAGELSDEEFERVKARILEP